VGGKGEKGVRGGVVVDSVTVMRESGDIGGGRKKRKKEQRAFLDRYRVRAPREEREGGGDKGPAPLVLLQIALRVELSCFDGLGVEKKGKERSGGGRERRAQLQR